jgi:hypothetical protein
MIAWSDTQSLLYNTFAHDQTSCYARRQRYSYLDDVGERLHDPRVLVAVHLHGVDERDLRLRPVAERLQHGCVFLSVLVRIGPFANVEGRLTVTSRSASPSIWSGRADQSTVAMRPNQMHCTSSGSESFSSSCCALTTATICAPISPAQSAVGWKTNLLERGIALAGLLEGADDRLLRDGGLLLDPPLRDGGDARGLEVRIEGLAVTLCGREEREEVAYAAAAERAREVLDRLLGEVRAEDERERVRRYTWMRVRETLEGKDRGSD